MSYAKAKYLLKWTVGLYQFIGDANMKIKEIISGDFRKEEVKTEAQRWLKKIKILNKVTPDGENVPIDALDKLLVKLLFKYPITMQWVSLTILEGGELPWYTVSFKDKKTHEWLGSFYGITIYEIYCKAVLFCYAKAQTMKE